MESSSTGSKTLLKQGHQWDGFLPKEEVSPHSLYIPVIAEMQNLGVKKKDKNT